MKIWKLHNRGVRGRRRGEGGGREKKKGGGEGMGDDGVGKRKETWDIKNSEKDKI